MVDVVLVVAVALLVGGVVASAVPLVPGALLSLAGIYLHWWHTGYAEPGAVFLVVAVLIGLAALALDHLSSAISARVSGTSLRTAGITAVVALALLVVTGPVGSLLGALGTVFALEYRRSGAVEESLRMAVYTILGMLASMGMQVLLTGTLLVAFLLAVVL